MEAVSSTDTSQSRSECVQFTALESDDKKGVYKFNVKLIKAADDILIRPVCTLLPKITEITPVFSNNGIEQNTPIEITFNKSLDSATFTDFSSIILIENETRDLWEFFNTPYFSSSETKLVIPPNPEKLILSPDGSQNLLELKVTYDFSKASDIDGLPLDLSGSHSYRINKTFLDQKKVTLTVSSESEYGTFLSAGEKECTVGYTIDLQFTLNKESYIFKGLEAVSTGSGTVLSEEDVLFTILESDDEAGIYKVNVRVLKEINDILIRPKCTLIENAEVTITKSEKGTENINPADGTKVQSFINRSYSVSFSPDDDYEFIRWELYDIKTDSSITNGTYVKLEDPAQPSTNYSVTQVPDNGIELALRPVVAERPQIISYSPMTLDELKDSSIQVLFDHDMDEGSIYYSDDELKSLIADVGEENLLSSAMSEGKYYGYKKDGKTFFKNISFEDNDSYENITECFDEPFFATPRLLNINTSKENKLPDFTQVLVTIEKDFFYKAEGANSQYKNISMWYGKKWVYQVNDMEDTDAPRIADPEDVKVFIKSGENLTEQTEITSSGTEPVPSESMVFNRDGKITLNIKVTDTGSGPASNFYLFLTKVQNENYEGVSSSAQNKSVKYNSVTSQKGVYNGEIALDSLFDDGLCDGVYKLNFEFSDRSGKTVTYPENESYYFTVDNTAPNGKDEKISASAGDASSYFKISWAPVSKDFSEAIVSYKTNGTQTASYAVKKGENSNSQALTLDSMSDKYKVSIVYKDFAGNISEPYEIPSFMTGFTVTESTEKVLFSGIPLSDNGVTATAYFSDGTTDDISSSAIITSPVTNIASEVEATFTSGEITKKVSLGTFYVAASGAKPTDSPVKLTEYTGTLAGGTYYAFGDFPQTISSISSYSTSTVYNGWYLGSDGYFYAKCTENAYESGYKYSDGTIVAYSSENSEKYFKVEPIKWRVLNPSASGNKILLAESILTANIPYYGSTSGRTLNGTSIYANNYNYSNIRAYLNGTENQFVTDGGTATKYDVDWTGKGFLQTAFTSSAQRLIAETIVDNSAASTNPASKASLWNRGTNNYACGNTSDKIFLLSEKEATTSNYGFTEYDQYGAGNSRIRETTDYAKANYASQSSTAGKDRRWWLRSPSFADSRLARYINYYGYADYGDYVSKEDCGVVPALCVAPEALE